MLTPNMWNTLPEAVLWGADNGRFSAPEKYSDAVFFKWLSERDASRCLFATAPDELGDHDSTVSLSTPVLPKIRALGYKAAFVAQDGWMSRSTPWDLFDCMFIGGTTQFKIRSHKVVEESLDRGKWVHMGRVNSWKRIMLAVEMGCDSVDGTFLKFGPAVNSPILLGWLDRLDEVGVGIF